MKWLAGLLLVGVVALTCSVGYYLVFPKISALKTGNPGKTSFMEYREREWEGKGKKIRIQHVWVPLSRISPYLVKAVLIAEDDKFWRHEGFDFEAIQKAIERDIKERKLKFGGSTISQQLAKNLYLTPARNPVRKVKEAILTWRLERELPKRRILEIYLNVVEWGEGVFGAEAAARRYFGTSAAALSPMEAARLATVLPNPRKYSPLSGSRYVEKRSKIIYAIMVRRGVVTPEYEDAAEDGAAESGDSVGSEIEKKVFEITKPQP